MVAKIAGEPDPIVLRFGGGIHSRASEDEINPAECADGQNFQLDLEDTQFKPRNPFDLLGTVPNGAEIRGGGQLQKADGSIFTFVQAGDTVYSWDGASFSSIATVAPTAKLRGRLEQNFQLDDKLYITDMNLVETVKEWDGTTFQDMVHNLTGDFLAKYGFVSNERAFFGNVVSNAVATPHMLVGSKRSFPGTLSISDRPSSALAEDAPFFLLTPDLRPINGLVEAFQQIVISSLRGSMWILTGANSKDFAIAELYPRSAAVADESVAYIGNDVVYGRQGRIESVLSTEKFADVQTDDITVPIKDKLEGFKTWRVAYNSRVQRVYFFPDDENEVWVYHKDLADDTPGTLRLADTPRNVSPWSKWTTQHESNFTPTFVMNLLDPLDGLEYVFFGDASGNWYKMEGTLNQGDANSAAIASERLSVLYRMPANAQAFDIEGWINYRKDRAATVSMTFEYAGTSVFNETITITIPAVTNRPTYGGTTYYGGSDFYGTPFAGRVTRQQFAPAGRGDLFQVRLRVESSETFEIQEVGLRLQAAS